MSEFNQSNVFGAPEAFLWVHLISIFLHHPVENPNRKARAGAAFATDGDIAALGGEDGFGQR